METSLLFSLIGLLLSNETTCEEIFKGNTQDIKICEEISMLLKKLNEEDLERQINLIKSHINQLNTESLKKLLKEIDDTSNKLQKAIEDKIKELELNEDNFDFGDR